MPPDGRAHAGGSDPQPGEVYFEFQQVGQAIKVVAVDAGTGIEVTVVGPTTASQDDLEQVALAKLRRRMARDGGSGNHKSG